MRKAKGGRPRGFTLIELVVAVAIIGLISAIAMRQLGQTQFQAYLASMKADLRNFAMAEESYYYDFGMYAPSTAAVGDRGFLLTPGVTITVNEATKAGWSATATHQRTSMKCYIYSENAGPIGTTTDSGSLSCS